MAEEQQNVAGNSELPKSLSEEPKSKKENQEAEKENANADESKNEQLKEEYTGHRIAIDPCELRALPLRNHDDANEQNA